MPGGGPDVDGAPTEKSVADVEVERHEVLSVLMADVLQRGVCVGCRPAA